MSVVSACVSIAADTHVPGRTKLMVALATPLNLQAIVIAEHEDPDELLLIGAARSCVLAVVAAMALLYPPRSASDTATADVRFIPMTLNPSPLDFRFFTFQND